MHRALLLATLAACEAKPAAVVVVIDTDLEIPTEMDAIGIAVEEEGGALLAAEDYPVTDGTTALPASFGVVRSGHPGEEGTLELAVAVVGDRFRATALAELEGATVFSTYAITGFHEGFVTELKLDLSRVCLTTLCPDGQTCRPEGCAAPEIDPDALSEHR